MEHSRLRRVMTFALGRRRVVTVGLMAAAAIIAIGVTSFALRQWVASPASAGRSAPTAAAPAMAIAGTGSRTSDWFHLDGGTYRVVLKNDDGSSPAGQAIMRGVADPRPQPDCSQGCSNAQAPIVALTSAGPKTVTLPAGHYVLDVVVMDGPAPWTLTISKDDQ